MKLFDKKGSSNKRIPKNLERGRPERREIKPKKGILPVLLVLVLILQTVIPAIDALNNAPGAHAEFSCSHVHDEGCYVIENVVMAPICEHKDCTPGMICTLETASEEPETNNETEEPEANSEPKDTEEPGQGSSIHKLHAVSGGQ